MPSAQFIFHAELNDFLPAARRGLPVLLTYASHQSLKPWSSRSVCRMWRSAACCYLGSQPPPACVRRMAAGWRSSPVTACRPEGRALWWITTWGAWLLTCACWVQWITRRMLQQQGMQDLQEAVAELMELLAALGMGDEARQQLREAMQGNAEALEEQVDDYVGQEIAENMAQEYEKRPPLDDLMNRPFETLTARERDELRQQVARRAAQLRSRAALRQKPGKEGTLDPKATLRANLQYGSVPIKMKFKHKQLKPKLVLIADVSTSMRPVAEFMVRLMYELSDQISRARSFAFINHIHDLTHDFEQSRASEVVQ